MSQNLPKTILFYGVEHVFVNVSMFKLNLKRTTRTVLILIVHRFQKGKEVVCVLSIVYEGLVEFIV